MNSPKPSRKIQFTLRITVIGLLASGCKKKTEIIHNPLPERPIQSSPLAAPALQTGSTLFERIPPEQSGIPFQIEWDRDKVKHMLFLTTAGGLCAGDYNGDGKPDLYLTNAKGGNRLYQNLGDFRFKDVTETAGLLHASGQSGGAGFVDIDNDGDLDLYVCIFEGPNRFYINDGRGKFTDQAADYGLAYNGASVMMSFADYDNDGDLDGYLLTTSKPPPTGTKFQVKYVGDKPEILPELKEYWDFIYLPNKRAVKVESGQYDHLYRNNGDGTFTDVSRKAGIDGNYFGQSATWWDYNHDGYADLYVANDFKGPDHLYRNNRDGTFTDVIKETIPHTPWFSMGSDFGDINNDGRFDFISTDMSAMSHYKQKMDMGDMSDSGWFLDWAEPRQYMRNAVYLNTGTERMMEVAFLTGLQSSGWTWTPRFADFDNDGRLDIFLANGMTRDTMNADVTGFAEQNLQAGTKAYNDFWWNQPMRKEPNKAFQNQGDLKFKDVATEWGLDRLGVSFGMVTTDLNGDGRLDLVVNNGDEPASVYKNTANEGNRIVVRLQGRRANRQGAGASIKIKTASGEQIRYLSLARGWTSSSELMAHFGLGTDEKIDRLEVRWPGGGPQVFEDLAVNQSYTITEPETSPPVQPETAAAPWFSRNNQRIPHRHREIAYDDFKDQPLLPNKLSQLGPGLAWGDVDGDQDEDLYIGGAKGQAGTLFIQTEIGQFTPRPQTAFETDQNIEQMAPLFFDADGDGDADLYVVSGGVEWPVQDEHYEDRLYLNDGTGQFTRAPEGRLPPLRESGSAATAADFDRDGDLDLFIGSRLVPGAYPTKPKSVLLQNDGRGFFTDVTDVSAAGLRQVGMVTSALWSDTDGDGWQDLFLTSDWGPVDFFHNVDGMLQNRTKEVGLAKVTGWWNGLTAGDVDNDGDIDYIATNFGLNSKYKASLKKPQVMYYGQFQPGRSPCIVEAKFEGDRLLPHRGLSCSRNAIPDLGTRFPSFHSFASSTLEEIYELDTLKNSYSVTANTLASGIFLNSGRGKFAFKPLPRIAQASAAYGIAFLDFDADGNGDLYLVQNFFGPQPETGHQDGGLSQILLGNGDGSFRPVGPDTSGLLISQDAKSLAISDINQDGQPDLVVGVNDGELQVFENRWTPTGTRYEVRLKGKKGNPNAIGAKVAIHFSDGAMRLAEARAGGGYLSQSTPHLYFGTATQAKVEKISVTWPDGTTGEFAGVEGHTFTIEQGD